MRIGIMLRSIDEKGGVGVYTRYLTEELLGLDQKNQYILFFHSPSQLGRWTGYANASARVVRAPNKAMWDQVAIPWECWRNQVDVLLHPKFTLPLLAPCKTVMVVHGADWFVPDQARFYSRLDVWYIKAFMPAYFRKASTVVSVSQLTTDNFTALPGLAGDKIRTIYFGPGRHFRRVEDARTLQTVRERYRLPERFVLTLSKYDGGERKNMRGILDAYRLHHGKTAHRLVVVGKDCSRFRRRYGVPASGWGEDVLFYDWVEQEDLPSFYSLADLYLYPSNVEAFPIPLTEAMACGTPIITSQANGLKEIAGDAAVLVDPTDRTAIAEAMERVLSDPDLRAALTLRGLDRARQFSWERCGREMLHILESLRPERRGRRE